MDSTGYGEMLSGLFPPEYPYGVIAVRSFSAYRISTKKRVGLKLARKLVTKSIFNPQILCLQVKSANSINGLSTKKECISKWSASCADSNTPKSYWLGINENSDKRTVSISLSHCAPTGYELQTRKGNICSLIELTFQSDELVFHPQSADDGGWRAFVADKKYKIGKSEVDDKHIAVVQYHLVITTRNSSTAPCVPVTITGGDQRVTHYISDVNTDPTISVIHKEVLQKLSLIPVQIKHNTFIQQLAMKLPHWQSTAKLFGLSEVDIQEIEVDYCTGQRQDGSFPPIFRGEQAYQALRRWTESKGHYATYADLLVALYNATLSNEHTTDAWWYAYHELTLCSHYFNAT
ncbi:uncharacterized protein [Dysidea avara]|uniref:uncharacterized protein n=1 Tax=Dysidea avara TaxID=196820 RepID=UPI00331CACB9